MKLRRRNPYTKMAEKDLTSDGSVVTMLSWVATVLNCNEEQRQRLVKAIFKGIERFNSRNGDPTVEGRELVNTLKREYRLVGICPNSMYIKVDGPKDRLDAIFVHPWGTPKLKFVHKKLPIEITVGSDLRFDSSVLKELSRAGYNQMLKESISVQGLTG